MISKIFQFVKNNKSEITLFLCVFLISSFSFAFGYIIGRTNERPYLEFQDVINNEQIDNEQQEEYKTM